MVVERSLEKRLLAREVSVLSPSTEVDLYTNTLTAKLCLYFILSVSPFSSVVRSLENRLLVQEVSVLSPSTEVDLYEYINCEAVSVLYSVR